MASKAIVLSLDDLNRRIRKGADNTTDSEKLERQQAREQGFSLPEEDSEDESEEDSEDEDGYLEADDLFEDDWEEEDEVICVDVPLPTDATIQMKDDKVFVVTSTHEVDIAHGVDDDCPSIGDCLKARGYEFHGNYFNVYAANRTAQMLAQNWYFANSKIEQRGYGSYKEHIHSDGVFRARAIGQHEQKLNVDVEIRTAASPGSTSDSSSNTIPDEE